MRMFIPLSPTHVQELAAIGQLAGPLEGVIPNDAFAQWIESDDPEDMEFAALSRAGDLALLLAETNQRVVAVVDVDVDGLEISDEPAGTAFLADLSSGQIASLHVDDALNKTVIADARKALASDDDSGEAELAAVDDCDLLWFDALELADVAVSLS
ncbi:MAG: hypothetical protein GM44_1875 [actinobacterium acAMD-2]|mgnify:FL=1|jgi:hypothetical protein|nr:MAG: hypothetical protein GM44_1875 [actinobacterium acAMD-2]HAS07856.1 hypothetical protein [Actinomycetota bacterium]